MSKLLKSKFLFGVMLVTVLVLGGAVVASAQTTTVVAPAFNYSGVMRVGMSGPGISTLQAALNSVQSGTIVVDGKFGPATLAAVKQFQASKGLSVDGVVGPMTGNALAQATVAIITVPSNLPAGCTSTSGYSTTSGVKCDSGVSGLPAGCSSTSGYSPTTGAKCDGGSSSTGSGSLSGGSGDVTLESLSAYSGENVGEGAEDVKVMGFSVEADDNSDVDVTSVKLEFFQATTTDSRKLADYASEVTVWMGSTKVGEADPADFSESSKYYSKSISLDGAVIEAGETAKFYVAVTALDNLDSGDYGGDDWSVDLLSVRFEDGDGVVTTESGSASGTDGSGTFEKSFDFDSFATANAVSLKTALKTGAAADAINLAHVINVESGTTDTDGVEILNFTMKAEGSDINVTEIPMVFTVGGTASNESLVIKSAHLLMDGDEIGSEVVPDAGAVTFNDLDFTINEGDTAEFTVEIDIQDLTGALTDADTFQASITSTNADAVVAEDSSGEELSDTETSGSAVGGTSVVHDTGIQVAFVSSTATISHAGDINNTTDSDQGTFTVTFDVTAFDGDMFLDGTKPTEAAADAVMARVSVSNTDTYVDSNIRSSTGATQTGTLDTTSTYTILEGQTERFTVTYVTTAGADGLFQVSLLSLAYSAVSNVTSGDTMYNFNMDEYKTPSLNMQNDAS